MRELRFVGFAVVLTLCVSQLLASDVLDYSDVSDFAQEVAQHEIALAEFFAPWCGHCKKLAPEFEKAATKLKDNDPPVPLIKVDCTTDLGKATCEKFGVTGFPTLKIFRNGEVAQDYDGPREAEGIYKFMRSQSGPSAKELKNVKDFEKFLEHSELAVIGFFEGESKLKDSFHKVADTERDRFRFAYTTNKEVLEKAGGLNDDIVAFLPKQLHSKFEESHIRYDGNYDTDKIKQFLLQETVGLAGVRTQSNNFQFTKRPLFFVYYNLDYTKDPKGSHYWRNRVLKVAQDFKRKAQFAVCNKDEFLNELQQFGLGDRKESDKPLVAALGEDGLKYPFDKEFTIENLKQFVQDVLDNKIEAYIKSEPLPEDQGDLKVVVGKNFKELITDSDKDVLIEFYAPWCGHCKSLAPKYEELATKLANEDVIIAKMDATANDVPPPFAVRGYPTIFWVPKNDKQNPVPYQGAREVKDFIKYIAQHSTDGLRGYDRKGKKMKTTEEL